MNWIKKNPAQTVLAVLSLLLLIGAVMIFLNMNQYAAEVIAKPPAGTPQSKPPTVDMEKIDKALENLAQPAQWNTNPEKQGLLLVSRQYTANNGALQRPEGGMFNPPVPNKWLLDHGLDYTNPGVLDLDPDGDGFSVHWEYLGMDGLSHTNNNDPLAPVMGADGKPLADDSTDPQDAKSHPPYYLRLQVANMVSIPFRLRFMAADVDKNGTTAQINTIDRGGKTEFVLVGAMIPGTTYKVDKYEEKIDRTGDSEKDVSVLTVVNTRNGQKVALQKGLIINSPESYAVLHYTWVPVGGQPTKDMNLEKDKTFSLPPEADKQYKVVDIKPTAATGIKVTAGEVTILLPSGQKVVLKFPAPPAPK